MPRSSLYDRDVPGSRALYDISQSATRRPRPSTSLTLAEVLPLTSDASLDQYEQLSCSLLASSQANDERTLERWAADWLETLETSHRDSPAAQVSGAINTRAIRVARYARSQLAERKCGPPTSALSRAQFVVARVHGFSSWLTLIRHLESLKLAYSPIAGFELAVAAIAAGNAATLSNLLSAHPELSRTRSMREHHATLLHYVAASGVEGFRQCAPTNSTESAAILLQSGSDVDAEAEFDEGSWTTLGLVATSDSARAAGAQRDLIDVLLAHGARIDRRGSGGRWTSLVHACLEHRHVDAADYLVSRGAPLNLASAAGLGRMDNLRGIIADIPDMTSESEQLHSLDALFLACAFGHADAVNLLSDHGVDVNAEMNGRNGGHTALHVAAYHGRAPSVAALLGRSARVDAADRIWHATPLEWALTGWARTPASQSSEYRDVVAQLVGAGATTPDLQTWSAVLADGSMCAVLNGASA